MSDRDNMTIRNRVRKNPRPAIKWSTITISLFALEIGAIVNFISGIFGFDVEFPTLLSRSIIPNRGYVSPPNGWQETFLNFSPAYAWAVRVVLIYIYTFIVAWWMWRGYLLFRDHYRNADWTPRDDMVNRMQTHRWGQFGAIIVFAFVVMALFAPALGPTTVEENIREPFQNEITYYSEETGEIATVLIGDANTETVSRGSPDRNVGPMEYDSYGRFHPFGTLPSGKDLFTFMVSGARVSLVIGLIYLGMASLIAIVLALVTAYYKGLTDLLVIVTSDSVQSLPQLLLLILLSYVLSDTWLASIYDGAILLAVIFAVTGWPYLWRAVRGPALQISGQEWIDAAKSMGEKPRTIMRKHMLPYVVGYLMIYASLSLGGAIISVAGLSFLGLGITPPTPEWGRAVSVGQPYVATASWHISLLPGLLVVLIVTAFNALGDGIRDAIDPQSEGAESDEGIAAGGSGA